MSFVSDDTYPVAKKRYRCWFCDTRIDVGERHGKRSGADGGDFWTMRFHLECSSVAREEKWTQEDYECHDPFEFKRPMTAFDPKI